jgi:uncharacterized iron-regulated protein
MPSAGQIPRIRAAGARLAALILGLVLAVGAPAVSAAEAPHGLLSTQAGDRQLTWDAAVAELARADVVFLGEQHGDPATHRLELAMLRALHEAVGPRLILSLEMFERDVQPILDAYLQGRLSEEEFLAQSRPWPNYASDYRPLVEYAKTHGLRVLASNVPRRLASQVAKQGLDALGALSPDERKWAAADVNCPKDQLHERFKESMRDHPGMTEALVDRMFLAQCLKDATMAEAIAQAFEHPPSGPGSLAPLVPAPLVLHVNGAFHSDEGLGVPAQLRKRASGLDLRVTTVLPATSPDADPRKGLADYVFVVTRTEKE